MRESSLDMDDIDKAILTELQADSAMSNVELARRVNLSAPAIHARIKRLEDIGLIRGYVALIDRERIGYDMLCLVSVSLSIHQPEQIQGFRHAVSQMPEVLECFFATGDYDYWLKVVVRNRKELEYFLIDKLTPIPGVGRIQTRLVLDEVKNTTVLKIE